jgi:uncharacterized protein
MSGPVLSAMAPMQFVQPIGWPLCPMPDAQGRMHWPDLAASVRQRIEVILRTSPGEQLMHPEFGAGLDRVLHQPNTTQLRGATRDRIAEFLAAYEPRIFLDQLTVEPTEDRSEMLITIGYRLRATGVSAVLSARVPVAASALSNEGGAG